MAINCSAKVGVALEITENLPAESYLINLWRCEPIKTVIIPTHVFLTNDDDSTPYLSDAHKTLVSSFFQLKAVSVTLRPSGFVSAESVPNLTPYMEYLRGVYHDALTGKPELPYATLFPPDQPLHHNLTESHYENFELDTQKYADYETAIRQYISSRQSFSDVPDVFVAAVVGCGRGPLVTALLNAARDLKATFRVYALEKNPLTVACLEEKCRSDWTGADVTIVVQDMRQWTPPEQLDLLLSELLGGFGDNELSPECLAGPEKFLTENGVSIPQSYTSYLCPISSTKLYELFPETPVRFREHVYGFDVDHFEILDQPQPVFTFSHPRTGEFPTAFD